MSEDAKQRWLPLATAARQCGMTPADLKAFCEGPSPIAHGAFIGPDFYVWDRTVRLLNEKRAVHGEGVLRNE